MATRQLAQQVTDIIMQNKNLMKTIVLAVSALIVEQISEDKNVIGKVTENVAKNAAFINSLTSKLEEQRTP